MVTLEQIHVALKQAIKQSGMKQHEIANKLGITQPTVSEYVNGKSYPALDTLANLCEILDVDANEILCIKKSYL